MPYLPLDHSEPFAATLGVMLYPGTDADSTRKARAFASQFLATPIRHAQDAGHHVSYETLLQVAVDAGEPLDDIQKRWNDGLAVGDLFKVVWALFVSETGLASWENAYKIYKRCATQYKMTRSRSALSEIKSRYQTVAHLWAAWSIRGGKFQPQPDVGYDGSADFQSFLTEAEILRDWGQNWKPHRAKSDPLLPKNVWQVSEDWQPPCRQPGWPQTGVIPHMSLPEDLLQDLKPAGRPRKTD